MSLTISGMRTAAERAEYSPEMNRHISKLKDFRSKKKSDSDKEIMQMSKDVGQYFRSRVVERVTSLPKNTSFRKIKPSFCFLCGIRAYTAYYIGKRCYCENHRNYAAMANEERREMNFNQDPDLPGYQPSENIRRKKGA